MSRLGQQSYSKPSSPSAAGLRASSRLSVACASAARFCLGLWLSLLIHGTAWALPRPGSTAAPILQVPIDARSVGMGTAYTAVGGDLNSMHYNPAGIGPMLDREASFMYLKGFDDQNVENIAFASPLPFRGLSGNGYATMGTSLLFSQDGSINVNQTNPDGSLLNSRTISAGNDLVGMLTYSERVGRTSMDTSIGNVRLDHFAGVSGKLIHSTLAEQYSASAVGGDLGYLVKAPDLDWAVGTSLLNLGSKMKFISEGDPLPMTFKIGASHWITKPSQYTLTFAADGDYWVYERQWHMNAGFEYMASQWVAARIGYQFNQDVTGLTIGFGVRWTDFVLDYAWSMSDALTDTHRFSVTYRFGQANPEDREAQKSSWTDNRPRRQTPVNRLKPKPKPSSSSEPAPPVHDSGQGSPEWIY